MTNPSPGSCQERDRGFVVRGRRSTTKLNSPRFFRHRLHQVIPSLRHRLHTPSVETPMYVIDLLISIVCNLEYIFVIDSLSD